MKILTFNLLTVFACSAVAADAAEKPVEKLVVSPPIIQPQELVKITDKVMLPPVPVVYK
jgi:hypothetical protein